MRKIFKANKQKDFGDVNHIRMTYKHILCQMVHDKVKQLNFGINCVQHTLRSPAETCSQHRKQKNCHYISYPYKFACQ